MSDLPILLLTVLTAWVGGLLRGFAGFGGPAFILAVLTWFLTPIAVINKILVIEFVASCHLILGVRKHIDWRASMALIVPALFSMPLGHWALLHTDADTMRLAISLATLFSCVLMMFDIRLQRKLPLSGLVVIGFIGGVVIGASYIALVLVALILLGAYNREETRTLLVTSGFAFAAWYVVLALYRQQLQPGDVAAAIPMGVAYFAGSWMGANLFRHSTEQSYRRYALWLLILLALAGVVRQLITS